MASVVLGLIRVGGFGEEEWSPVCDASDHAAGLQYDGAGVTGDSGGGEWSDGGFLGGKGDKVYLVYSLASLTLPGRTCISLISFDGMDR